MNKKVIFGLAILLSIIFFYFITNSYHCIILNKMNLPKKIENIKNGKHYDLVLLNGKNLCGTCPSGEYIYKVSKKNDMIYVVPRHYTFNDIENFRYAFDIRGIIIKADFEIEELIKKISSCIKDKNSIRNFHLKLGVYKKIKKANILIF